jgi:hypothetical protein
VLDATVYWLLASLQKRYGARTNTAVRRVEQQIESSVTVSSSTDTKVGDVSEDDYWHQYFEDPSKWWDNCLNKRNPKAPDFKLRTTKKALWIDGWHTPDWVRVRFASD